MTIWLPTHFIHRGNMFVFPCSLVFTTDEVEHPWWLYSHAKFLGVRYSNFLYFYLRDALQHVTIMVWLARLSVTLDIEVLIFCR